MQEVRADGFDRLDPLGAARADHTIGPLPLLEPEVPPYPLAMVEWHDAWFDFERSASRPPPRLSGPDGRVPRQRGARFVSLAQEVLPDGEGFRAVTHIPLPDRRAPRPPRARRRRLGRSAGLVPIPATRYTPGPHVRIVRPDPRPGRRDARWPRTPSIVRPHPSGTGS